MPRDRRSMLLAASAGAVAGALLPAAHTALTRAMLERNVRALRDGDPRPLLAFYAQDAVVRFPGEHSWGRTYRGRAEIAAFLERFLAAGLRGRVGAVLVEGPPWRSTIALEFDDEAVAPDGEVLYENRAVIVARTRWGRIVDEEVYEDTQKVAAFDELVAARGLAVPV